MYSSEEMLKDPIYNDVRDYGSSIADHLHKDYATILGITGPPGSGKSTLAMLLGFFINPFKFSIPNNVALKPTSDAFLKQFEDLDRYEAIVGDESAWYAYNRTFMKQFQIYLMQYLKTARKHQNKAILLCMTSIHKFDKDLRTGDTMYQWIQILDRGLGALFQASPNFFSNDGFRIKENEKLFEVWHRNRKDNKIRLEDLKSFLEKKSSNFVDFIQFPDLPKPWKKEYLDLTIDARKWYLEHRKAMKQSSAVAEEKRYESLCTLADWVHTGDEQIAGRTFEEISERIGVSASTIMRWSKQAQEKNEKD